MDNQSNHLPSPTETGRVVTGGRSSRAIMEVLGNHHTPCMLPIEVIILGDRRFSGIRVLDRYPKLLIPRVNPIHQLLEPFPSRQIGE